GGVGERAAMVAGRGADHAAPADCWIETGKSIGHAANLERPYRLRAFELQAHLASAHTKGLGRHQRRPQGEAADGRPRGIDGSKGNGRTCTSCVHRREIESQNRLKIKPSWVCFSHDVHNFIDPLAFFWHPALARRPPAKVRTLYFPWTLMFGRAPSQDQK